jgi:importin subunit alpha-6/7
MSARERQDRQSDRKADYKRAVGVDELRRRRDTTLSQLRKEKRDDSLQKRRQMSAALAGLVMSSSSNNNNDSANAVATSDVGGAAESSASVFEWTDDDWTRVSNLLHSEQAESVLSGMRELRVALTTTDESPPVDELLERDLVPRLAQCLLASDNLDLVFESAWVLTNVASCTGAAPYAVVAAGVLPQCVRLLQDPNTPEQITDLLVWVIGNVAGEDAALRNVCLGESCLLALLQLLTEDDLSPSLQRSVAWALSNMCRGAPTPDFAYIGPILPTLAHLLKSGDKQVAVDALWSFAHLLEHCDNAIRQAVVDCGVCSSFAALLACKDIELVTPAVRAVGGVVSGSTEHTNAMLLASPFPALKRLLATKSKKLQLDLCWVLSNFTAGDEGQIQAVIDEGLISRVVELMAPGVDFGVRREACWVVSNAIVGGDVAQVLEMVDEDVIEALISTAQCSEPKVQVLSLDALARVLEVGAINEEEEGENVFKDMFEECGGLDMMNELFNADNEQVSALVDKLLAHYDDLTM